MPRSTVGRAAASLERARERGRVRADLALPETAWRFFGQVQGRFPIEQTAAPVDAAAWQATARRAVFAALSEDPPRSARPEGRGRAARP